jgi:hypothetical protein
MMIYDFYEGGYWVDGDEMTFLCCILFVVHGLRFRQKKHTAQHQNEWNPTKKAGTPCYCREGTVE